MKEVLRSLEVDLGERSYSISLGYNILPHCIKMLPKSLLEKEVFIISDNNVYGLYGACLENLLSKEGYRTLNFIIPAGEEAKSWTQAGVILKKMLEENLGRKSCVLALGGGVVGDLAGFVAALYRRGIPLIQIPTTLLAQVDSSIGGKVAVNHPLGKNMLGTFYQPAAVWADLSTLHSLPQEEWLAGLAEVIKYAVIWDCGFFCKLEERSREILYRDPAIIPDVIERCCRIKAEIVSRDEKDEGLRNILNFGHTIGHALESSTKFKKYRHGEAVAIGMVGAMEIACLLGLLAEEPVLRVRKLLTEWSLPAAFPSRLLYEVLNNLQYDKKAVGKEVVYILPVAIGEVVMKKGVPRELIQTALERIIVK